MDITVLIGYAAGFLTTIAFVPQVLQIWRTKSAKDVSLPAFLAFTLGVALWTVYGWLNRELPIVIWNAVTLVLAIAIVVMKLRFRERDR